MFGRQAKLAERYVFTPGAPYPVQEHVIKMRTLVANNQISRGLFQPIELKWIDANRDSALGYPPAWVGIWTTFLGLRSAGLNVKPVIWNNMKYYPYTASFVARFSYHLSVTLFTLEPAGRPVLAAQLRMHPYETEILRGDHYSGAAINGVLAENGGLAGSVVSPPLPPPIVLAPRGPQLVACRHCRRNFFDNLPACPWCGAPR